MFKANHRGAIPVIILMVTIGLLAAMYLLRPKTEPVPQTRIAPRVSTVILKKDRHEPVLELYGTIESPQLVNIESPVTTYVERTPFLEGDFVKKGDRLLILDQRDPQWIVDRWQAEVNDLSSQVESEKTRYQADLAALEDEQELVRLKQKNVEREAHLVKRQVGSPQRQEAAEQELRAQELAVTERQRAISDHVSRLKQIHAKLASATTQYEQAKLNLIRAELRSPFDARITKLSVGVGDRVTAGEAVIEIFDTTEVEIRAQVPHRAVAYLDRVLQKKAQLNAWAMIHDKKFVLKLERLASEVNERRAGVDALFSVDEQNEYLALGYTIPVYLSLTPRDDVFAVPITAIYDEERVYRVVDGKIERVEVQRMGYSLDKDDQRLALIRAETLKEGDAVMTTQLQQIANGMAVDVVDNQ